MTLAEVVKLARVPGHWYYANRFDEILHISPRWFTETYKPHARRAWGGKAFLVGYEGMPLYIASGEMLAQYATSFEDATADDWELTDA